MIKAAHIALPSLLLISSPVLSMNDGFYLGFNAGYAKSKITDEDNDSTSRNNGTLAIYAGYNFVPYAGLEIGNSFNYAPSGKEHDIAKFHNLHIGPTLSGELTQNLDIYNKIHFSYINLNVGTGDDSFNENFLGAYYELGLSYNLSQNVGITTSLSYTWAKKDQLTLSSYGVLTGLKFSF